MRLHVAPALCTLASTLIANRRGDPKIDEKCDTRLTEFEQKATELICRFKEKSGCPGIVAAISSSGKLVYSAGFGYADVEHLVPARPDTVFRIASISKAITSLLFGRYLEQGKVSLEEDVRSYLPEFPEKKYDGAYAKITLRSLLNHTGGIRSYKKLEGNQWPEYPEMLLKTPFKSAVEACKVFEDDDLLHTPGSKFAYSTFAFTLLSAALERACTRSTPAFDGIPTGQIDEKENGDDTIPRHCLISSQLSCLFTRLGLRDTYLDHNDRLIPNRASQYRRDGKGTLLNTPEADHSYKWAGGGIRSTATDLLKLCDHLCSLYTNRSLFPGIVSRETLEQLWTVSATNPESIWQPGLGWFIARRSGNPTGSEPRCPDRFYVGHSGGALGGTTMLLMSLPRRNSFDHLNSSNDDNQDDSLRFSNVPSIGVVVLTNLEGARGIAELAVSLAELTTDYFLKQSLHPIEGYQSSVSMFADRISPG